MAPLRPLLLFLVLLTAVPPPASEPVGRFFALDSSLVRGAAPSGLEQFRFLREVGIRTIISFDSHRPDFAMAESLGLRYVHIPIGYGSIPRKAELDFFATLDNQLTPGPYYVHCHGGKYRVGAMSALYRMQVDGWQGDSALGEMIRLGGKTDYPGLKSSVRGFSPVAASEIRAHAFNPMAKPPIPALGERMYQVNKAFRQIKQYVATGMEPDEMAGLALGLEELYYETYRLRLCSQCDSAGYGRFLSAAQAIQKRRLRRDFSGDWVRELQADCKSCHAAYRR